MSNDCKSLIKITSYSQKSKYILYQIELQDSNEWYSLNLRFSELRKLFKNVHHANNSYQFPSCYCIASTIKSILPDTYKKRFNQVRYQQLKNYFHWLSETTNLSSLPQFRSLINKAKQNQRDLLRGPVILPKNIDKQVGANAKQISNPTSYINI